MGEPQRTYHQYARHVSSALSPDKIDFYRNYPQYVAKRFPTLKAEWFVDIADGSHRGVKIFPWLENHIKSYQPITSPESTDIWQLTWDSVSESLGIQIEELTRTLRNRQPLRFLSVLDELRKSQELFSAAQTKIHVLNIHNEIDAISEISTGAFTVPSLPGIQFVGDLIVLKDFPGSPIIITYQMLLNSLDKLEAKFSWLFYVKYMSLHPSRQQYHTEQLFYDIYNTLESAYQTIGNEGIRICKLLEPLLVGISLKSLDPTTHDHTFGDIIKSTFKDDKPYLQPFIDKIWNIGTEYLNLHGPDGIPYLIEQYGQEKLHNYPIVSIEGGLAKMHLYGTSIRVSDEQALRDIAANFKREYFVAYYEKHKILPKIIDNWRLDNRIRKLIQKGRPGTIRECFRIPNEAWFRMEYDKNHNFNYFPQISDLLDDKAITPHLQSIYQLFAQDALDVMSLKKPYTYENTRLILEILDRPVIDIRAFYEEVEQLGHLPENWKVIQLMAKERELKIEARAFSILTFECRMMASACERNLGEEILPLFKQQSMTLTGSELKHKMDILSTLPETEEFTWIAFMEDLQQWNYTFRSFQQAYLINVLCDLFGVNHFRYLMNIFTDSILFSANKFTPPGFPGQFTTWDTHAGGNQGILQRLWTIITIIIIRSVMHKLDLEHRLTGSGDNQVLFVKLRKGRDLSRMIKLIKDKLQKAFEAVGLALKVEETWTSRDLVCYQRKYYYKGVLVPGGIKISARAFSGTGDINAGLNAIVTTAINGGVALTEQHSDPIIGPSFAYTEIFINLLGHHNWKRVVPRQKRPLVLLSMLSSDFGFLPFIQLNGFMYAGHQDTLSESLALLKFVWEHYPEYHALIAGAVRFKPGIRDLEAKLQLIVDPTTLNIDRPKLPEAIIKSNVENYLMNPANVINLQLRTMFECCKKEDQLKLAEELLKVRPINTALLHSLFEYSHIGSLLGTLSRFNKISSIVKLVGLNKMGPKETCFSKQVRALDEANLKYFFRRILSRVTYGLSFIGEVVSCDPGYYINYCKTNSLATNCVFSCRLFLIAYSYGLGTEFITGPYTPPPSEQLIFTDASLPSDLSTTLIINPCYNIPGTLHQLEESRGSYSLYIGSRTADPVRTIKLTTLDGVEAGTAIKTLLKILAWMKSTNSDSNILSFIMNQLGSRMEGLEELIPGLVPGTAGGCIDHRFGSPGTVMWAFSNSTSIISTWYQITSNRATLLQRGEEDRFVFFQQLYHHIYSALRFCQPYKERFGVIIRTDHCSYPIPQSTFTSPPLVLPGQEHLVGGLILDPSRKEALRLEALHFNSVMEKSTLYKGTGVEILSAVLGNQIATNIIMYSLGLEDLSYEEHKIHYNQTSINLSILRKIPLRNLLASVGIHLGAFGYFGQNITPSKLIKRFNTRAQLGSHSQSMTPFLDIIQAIITGGYLPELLVYTKSYWKWDSSLSLTNLITPLMKGIAKALSDWRETNYPIHIMIEVKGPQFNYQRLIQFLYNWHPSLARTIQINKGLTGSQLIEEINASHWSLQVMLVTDKGIATEHGRRILHDVAEHSVLDQPLSPTITTIPQLTAPATPPWIWTTPTHTLPEMNERSLITSLISERAEWPHSTTNLTKLMRWNKATSRGQFKLNEIWCRLSLPLPENSFVIGLAEGAGSFLSFLLHLQPKALGVYNSRILPETTPPAMAGLYIPPELLCPCSVHRRVKNLPENSSSFGDLSKEKTWEELNYFIRIEEDSYRIITCDIQYIPRVTIQILNRLNYWINNWKPELVILKVMLPMFLEDDQDWLSLLCSQFNIRTWIKPTFSNPYSTEVYLVLQQYSNHSKSVSRVTLTSLLDNWNLLKWMLTDKILGAGLTEALKINLDISNCPNYLMLFDLESRVSGGAILSLIQEPLLYLLRSLYSKYWLRHELDRTEQVILHSLSTQSKSIRFKYQAIMIALELYLKFRGLVISDFAHERMYEFLNHNIGDVLEYLNTKENETTIYKNWDEVLQILGYLLSTQDSFSKSESIELLKAWIWLTLNEDRFLIFNDYPKTGLELLYCQLINLSRSQHMDWMKIVFRPNNFFILTRVLLDFLDFIAWESCQVSVDNLLLKSLVSDLPWPKRLSNEKGGTITIVSILEGVSNIPISLNTNLNIVVIFRFTDEQIGMGSGNLIFSKHFEQCTMEIYVNQPF